MLTALLLGALFCWGNEVSAYTYSGQWNTINTTQNDENDLVITGNSNITITNTINPQKEKVITITKEYTGFVGELRYYPAIHESNDYASLPINPSDTEIERFNRNCEQLSFQGTGNILTIKKNNDGSIQILFNGEDRTEEIKKNGSFYDEKTAKVTRVGNAQSSYTTTTTTNLGDANITVTGASSLTGKAEVQTTKAINVNTNSKLTAAWGISGGSISSGVNQFLRLGSFRTILPEDR